MRRQLAVQGSPLSSQCMPCTLSAWPGLPSLNPTRFFFLSCLQAFCVLPGQLDVRLLKLKEVSLYYVIMLKVRV